MLTQKNKSLISAIAKDRDNVRIIGIDKETGGLNDDRHRNDAIIPKNETGASFYPILQFAAIIYDGHFKQIGEPINVIIKHSKDKLDKTVGEWSKNQFKNTLMIQCPKADLTLEEAEAFIMEAFEGHGIEKNQSAFMLGNSIRLDMEFLSAQMPTLKEYFHYRLIDVSTLKTILSVIYGELADFKKEGTHDALRDIEESVEELHFYLDKFFIPIEKLLNP